MIHVLVSDELTQVSVAYPLLKERQKIERYFTTVKNSNSDPPEEGLRSNSIEHFRFLRGRNKDLKSNQLMNFSIFSYDNSIHSLTKYTTFEVIKGHLDIQELHNNLILLCYVQTIMKLLRCL